MRDSVHFSILFWTRGTQEDAKRSFYVSVLEIGEWLRAGTRPQKSLDSLLRPAYIEPSD